MMTIFGCWDCAKAELPNAHPANNKGKTNFFTACEGQFLSLIWDLNRVRCLAVRLTNAIALAVRNIAVIRISVFILDFSFPSFFVRVERICLHSFQKKNAAEIAKKVWTREENPSCQRSSTTERGVKVTPTFSTSDLNWRRGRSQKDFARASQAATASSHYLMLLKNP